MASSSPPGGLHLQAGCLCLRRDGYFLADSGLTPLGQPPTLPPGDFLPVQDGRPPMPLSGDIVPMQEDHFVTEWGLGDFLHVQDG
uniref:Uncharacterized protein n=1 Tax=Oryza punctata TaxID=4537 RepID=A0A0E0KNS6_ORYPU